MLYPRVLFVVIHLFFNANLCVLDKPYTLVLPCLFVYLFAWKTYQIIRMLSSGGYIGVRTLNTALLFDLLFCPRREIQTLYLLGIDIYTLYSVIPLYRFVSSLYAYSVLDCLLRLGGIFQNICCDRWVC